MRSRTLLGAMLLAIAGSSVPTPGSGRSEVLCSIDPMGGPPTTKSSFFLGIARPDTVHVPRHPEGLPGEAALHGQRIEVLRAGGAAAGTATPGDAVVVVPWDYGADCKPLPRRGSARFAEPGTVGLYLVSLRDPEWWIEGTPTFDARFADYHPYPWGRGFRFEVPRVEGRRWDAFDDAQILSAEALFEVFLAVARPDRAATAAALLEWVESRPDLAARYPISGMVRHARYRRMMEGARSVEIPLVGTWRLRVRFGGGPERPVFLRTGAAPFRPWWDGPAHEKIAADAEPEGYTVYAAGALDESGLPHAVHEANASPCRLGSLTVRPKPGSNASAEWEVRLDPMYLARCLGEEGRYSPEEVRTLEDTWATTRVDEAGAVTLEWRVSSEGARMAVTGERVSSEVMRER